MQIHANPEHNQHPLTPIINIIPKNRTHPTNNPKHPHPTLQHPQPKPNNPHPNPLLASNPTRQQQNHNLQPPPPYPLKLSSLDIED